MPHNGGKKSCHGRSLKKCKRYRDEGRRDKNKARRMAQRLKKFAKRKAKRESKKLI